MCFAALCCGRGQVYVWSVVLCLSHGCVPVRSQLMRMHTCTPHFLILHVALVGSDMAPEGGETQKFKEVFRDRRPIKLSF